MKTKGIGLNLTLGPYDQVAIFPSKVNKISMSCQQISKERQGLEVSALIVWKIDHEEDGPMRAFKFLGEDLISDTPRTANKLIETVVTSVIRNYIANSTIEEVRQNRDQIR